MADFTKITTYETDALDRLLSEYKNADNLRSIVSIFADALQTVENDVYDVYTLRGIDTAEGIQLDNIAAVLGLSRSGLTDAQLKVRIYAKIAENTSRGTFEQVVGIFKLLTSADYVQADEIFPAGLRLIAVNATYDITTASDIVNAMYSAKAAGVKLDAVVVTGDNVFGFYGDADALGFGDVTDPLVGGNFADKLN